MAVAENDRLDAVKSALDDLLASRMADLMGFVRASRELVDQIAEVDRQLAIAKQKGEAQGVRDDEADVLEEVRGDLIDRLAEITSAAG